jgi:hypothetical protein
MKTTYQVTTAEGNIATRKSAHPYTHVLLGRRDYIRHRAYINGSDLYAANYKWYTKTAARDVNVLDRYETAEKVAREVAEAKEKVAGYASEAEYVAAKRAESIARECPEGQDMGPEEALRWSKSRVNAEKAIAEFTSERFWTACRVAEAAPAPAKQPKAAK